MHNNYFFLRQLSDQLKKELVGFRFGALFSQSKNELIIALYKGEAERFIRAHLAPQFCCLSFPSTFGRAKRNSVDLFQSINDLEIADVVQVENDRSFYFELENAKKLLFKMHGNRSNVILYDKEKVHEVFNSKLQQDLNLNIDSLTKEVLLNKKAFKIHEGNYQKIIPTLGKAFDRYFIDKDYLQSDPETQYQILSDLLKYLEKPDLFIRTPAASLPQLCLYKTDDIKAQIEKPSEALNAFFREYITVSNLESEKRNIRNSLTSKIRKTKSYIDKSMQKLEGLEKINSYKHLGDMIMANLHQIKSYEKEVKLIDFYTGKSIKIPLKSSLTPQLNAEKYYRKAKKQQLEINALRLNIQNKKILVADLINQVSKLDEVTSLKQIKKVPAKNQVKAESPYHKVTYMDYEILVGKNANKNELLTFKTAKKEDLFLHAKDSAGSHVIIRKKGNQNFPKPVVEKAAMFAAFYSKNRSEALCRVMYTPRKYVRKAKGAPAGAVIVEREKVVLVKPEKIPSILPS